MSPLVVLDADVLGRERTGEETYLANLLRELPGLAPDLRFAAVTRFPELVPPGVEAIALPARSQELRMAWTLPRLLRRLRPALAHFQHAIPLRCPCPAVVTVHDLSFERDPSVLGLKDRLIFRTVVPRAARKAARLLAVSERTKTDLVQLYGVPEERVTVTYHGIDPAFSPGGEPDSYVLFVGSIQERKNPLAAAEAASEAGLRLVVAGPNRDDSLSRELQRRGAELRGYLGKPELAQLYRNAACLILPSRFEGFGLPVLEAMACGTPVVATPEPALQEVGGDAALYAPPERLGEAVRRAVEERPRLAELGLARAREFSWRKTAEGTLAAYRVVLAR